MQLGSPHCVVHSTSVEVCRVLGCLGGGKAIGAGGTTTATVVEADGPPFDARSEPRRTSLPRDTTLSTGGRGTTEAWRSEEEEEEGG